MRLRGIVALAFALSVLSGCSGGGGGGSQPPSQPRTQFSGTATTNVPLAGYFVDILGTFGTTRAVLGQGTVASDGRYSAGTFTGSAPFPMVAWQTVNNDQAQYPRVWSIAYQNGTVNATPLTSLVVARLLNRRPGRFDDRAVF